MAENELLEPAETAIQQCLGLKQNESCVIVTDDKRRSIADALTDAARQVSDEVTTVQFPVGEQHGEEPPAPVAAAMSAADAFLAPTTKSLSHTRARSDACASGARGATLPGITESVFAEGLQANYAAIERHCENVYDAVNEARELHISSPSGTDFTVSIEHRPWQQDTGMINQPGDFSNLPAGEVFIAPTTANGTYVVDGTMRPHGLLEDEEFIRFEVSDGYVTDISDPAIRNQVEAAAETVGDAAYNLAEVGIGTNVGIDTLVGSVLLDEKAAGTVHIAIGDNAGIGGNTEAPLHLDGIVREPTVTVDGKELPLPAPAPA
jgi:leucyl aminopeptidase (aminopeptidase T)